MALTIQHTGLVELKYYVDESKTSEKGNYSIDSNSTVRKEAYEMFRGFEFVLTASSGKLVMFAKTEFERAEWIQAIQNVITSASEIASIPETVESHLEVIVGLLAC